MQTFELESRQIKLAEYQELRATTNWGEISPDFAIKALGNSIYSLAVMSGDEIVGMGRILGDGGAYFYVQDIIIKPPYKQLDVGKMIMADIMLWLEQNAPENAFIGLMAASGTHQFFERFGFEPRPQERPGMYVRR